MVPIKRRSDAEIAREYLEHYLDLVVSSINSAFPSFSASLFHAANGELHIKIIWK